MNTITGHSDFQSPQMSEANLPETSGSRRNCSTGMTLVELMVSVTILTAIILIVSTLLSNAQRAVNLSQDTITADADARAVVGRIRADLAGLTSEGFLAIYTDADDRQHLVFTAAGSYRSMTETDEPTVANAARIDYGMTGDDDKNVLWRRAVLLNGEDGQVAARGDMEKISLADYKVMSRPDIDAALGGFTTMPTITLPPNSLADLENLWPYLARPCTELKIEWADGTLAGDILIWYGPGATKGDGEIEYTTSAGKYCALWTHWKKDNWPLALRITFELGKGKTTQSYEVIVDLPR